MFRVCTASIVSILLTAMAAPAALAADGKPLKPMAKPAIKAGETKVWRGGGKEWMEMVMAVDESTASYAQTDGCRITRPHEEFSPWLKWEGCAFGSGEGSGKLIDGTIWPLKTGTKFVYEYAGRDHRGRSWQGRMDCTVEGTARIAVPAGEFDTYRLVCDTKNIRRVWHIAPKLGTTVKFSRKRFDGSRSSTREMVSFTPGS